MYTCVVAYLSNFDNNLFVRKLEVPERTVKAAYCLCNKLYAKEILAKDKSEDDYYPEIDAFIEDAGLDVSVSAVSDKLAQQFFDADCHFDVVWL